jgi:hypothetical protein
MIKSCVINYFCDGYNFVPQNNTIRIYTFVDHSGVL